MRSWQERLFEPLGATRTESTNARIIAATHRDLDARVESGVFRQDLYYRIKVVRIDLPPLRKRREDIPLLVQHYIGLFNAVRSKQVTGVSPDAMGVLTARDYPGNVRELQNIIERAFVLLGAGQIELGQLPPELVPVSRPPRGGGGIDEAVQAAEAQAIREALARSGGNRLASARALRMHKSTFFRKTRRLGISLPEHDGRARCKPEPSES